MILCFASNNILIDKQRNKISDRILRLRSSRNRKILPGPFHGLPLIRFLCGQVGKIPAIMSKALFWNVELYEVLCYPYPNFISHSQW